MKSTGRRSNVPPNARYIKGDVTCLDQLEPAFSEHLDSVLHIVGQVSLVRSYNDPTLDLRTNVGARSMCFSCVLSTVCPGSFMPAR